MKVYDPASGELLLSLTSEWAVWGIDYSGNGKLAIANSAKTIEIWDPPSGNKLQILDAPQFITSIVFDPDGEWLAAGGEESLIIYDLSTGDIRHNLDAHEPYVMGIAVNNDGSRIASSGGRIWNPDSGELLHSLPSWGAQPFFSTDGNHLLLKEVGTLKTYVLDLEELVALARSRVTRELTASECSLYRIAPCPSEDAYD